MATFETGKAVTDIEKPELLPGDWYVCRITKEPKLAPNNKKKNGLGPEDGGGDNLNLLTRVRHDNPKWNGRSFFPRIPWPSDYDLEVYDEYSGMSIYDTKLQRLVNWSAAFQGKKPEQLKGNKLIFDSGMEALLYVDDTEYDWRDGHEDELINSVDVFRMIPRPVE